MKTALPPLNSALPATMRSRCIVWVLCCLAFLLPLLPETSELPFYLCVIALPAVGILACTDRLVFALPVTLFLSYVGLSAFSFIISPLESTAGSPLALLGAHACGMAAAHIAVGRRDHVTMAVRAALVAAAAVSAIAIAQYYGIVPSDLMLDHEGRVTATFENPNHLGGYLACLLPVAGIFVVTAGSPAARWLWVGTGTSMYLALLFTASRGAWWAFLVSGAFAAVAAVRLAPSLPWHKARMGLGVLLCSWVIATVLYNLPTPAVVEGRAQLADRLATTPELYATEVQGLSSIGHRRLIWEVTRDMVTDHPLSGLGYGVFGSAYPAYRERLLASDSGYDSLDAGMRMNDVRFAHNEYLQIAAESGVPALVLFVVAIAWVLWSALKNPPLPELEAARMTLLIVIVASLLHSMVSYPLRLPAQGFLFWLAIGALRSVSTGSPSQELTDRRPA